LGFEPWSGESPSDEICPTCGIQFGYDDSRPELREKVYRAWRKLWLRDPSAWVDPSEAVRALKEYNVEVRTMGRGGTVEYSEGSHSVTFDWEGAARPAKVVITGVPPQDWDTKLPWAVGRRAEVMTRVAEAFISDPEREEVYLGDGDTTAIIRRREVQR
jgi:hypothetical protein